MVKSDEKNRRELHSIRDTVESIWVAIILAFVLRAFIIEAFVIPTGSMAPRLMGEHWELICPGCGQEYAYGVPRANSAPGGFSTLERKTPTDAVCPNCEYPYPFTRRPEYPRNGDRVLVMKYLYRFAEPEPWDVVVFRNPQNNRENYIKRLIGLPGETIEIVHGDIFYRNNTPGASSEWKIRRKPNRAQDAMWQVVFDNDYQPNDELLTREAVPRRGWIASNPRWDLTRQHGRKFAFLGKSSAEIVFRSDKTVFLPHYGYNRQLEEDRMIDPGRDICSDLKLSFVVIPGAGQTNVGLLLSSFEHRFRGELRSDGTCMLLYDPPDGVEGNWVQWASAKVAPLSQHKPRQVALTHVDFRVSLSVDGQEVLASTDLQYPSTHQVLKDRLKNVYSKPIPTPQVKIAAWGAPCDLVHVKLYRDVYYTSPLLGPIPSGPLGEHAERLGVRGRSPGWGTTGNPITLRKFDASQHDEFFVLGDNSPHSLDGRGWVSAAPTLYLMDEEGNPVYKLGTVPRYNLIGKAFFVYWPAGFHVPGLPGLPILPNVGRMRMIR